MGFDASNSMIFPAGPGSALSRMRSASLNYIDLAVANGRYGDLRYPLVPIADGAGEVVAIGPDVRQFALGDRVAIRVSRSGSLATEAAPSPRGLAASPNAAR